jgi:adenylate kinase
VRLIMLGPPGSGKGTQAQTVISRFGIPQVSTGDILRASIKAGAELGRKAKAFMDAGQLVPDDVIIGIIRDRLAADDCKGGYLFDGFPRTVAQAEALDAMLAARGEKLDHVVCIEVPDEEIVGRLTGRLTCPSCGAMYHAVTMRPKNEGVCDRCAHGLIVRDDDKEETIRKRLGAYHAQTSPLIDYYQQKSLLRRVAGVGAVDDIRARVAKVFE